MPSTSLTGQDQLLFEVMYQCRAMRRYKPDPVPDELLVTLVDAALHGPSGSNAQNWSFVVVRDPEQKRRVQVAWKRAWGFYRDTVAKAGLRSHEDADARERIELACDHLADHLDTVPALIFVCVRKDAEFDRALLTPAGFVQMFRHLGPIGALKFGLAGTRSTAMSAGSTAYPAVQNILLAARAMGLGATMTTQHFFVPGEFERVLGLPRTITLAAVVPVGYPTGTFGPTRRPAPESVISWDRWSPATGAPS